MSDFQINDRACVLAPFTNAFPGTVVITDINDRGECQINDSAYIMPQYLVRPENLELV